MCFWPEIWEVHVVHARSKSTQWSEATLDLKDNHQGSGKWCQWNNFCCWCWWGMTKTNISTCSAEGRCIVFVLTVMVRTGVFSIHTAHGTDWMTMFRDLGAGENHSRCAGIQPWGDDAVPLHHFSDRQLWHWTQVWGCNAGYVPEWDGPAPQWHAGTLRHGAGRSCSSSGTVCLPWFACGADGHGGASQTHPNRSAANRMQSQVCWFGLQSVYWTDFQVLRKNRGVSNRQESKHSHLCLWYLDFATDICKDFERLLRRQCAQTLISRMHQVATSNYRMVSTLQNTISYLLLSYMWTVWTVQFTWYLLPWLFCRHLRFPNNSDLVWLLLRD